MKKMLFMAMMMVMAISARSAMPLGSSKNKPAVAKNDRHGSDHHVAMNTNRGNGGYFRR